MTDSRSIGFKTHWTPPAARPERVLWMLRKDTRVAEARLRGHPHGSELALYVKGQLLWSQVFKGGAGAMLGEVAETKRREFEQRGWRMDRTEASE